MRKAAAGGGGGGGDVIGPQHFKLVKRQEVYDMTTKKLMLSSSTYLQGGATSKKGRGRLRNDEQKCSVRYECMY